MHRSFGLFAVCAAILALFIFSAPVLADDPRPQLPPDEELKLAEQAARLNAEGIQLHRQGKGAEAIEKMQQALVIWQKVYPVSKHSDGHLNLASNLSWLGLMFQEQGAYEKALPYFERALTMFRKLYPESKYPDGHPHLFLGLHNVGNVLRDLGEYEKARPLLEQALAMCWRLYPAPKYPDGHADLATGLNDLALVLTRMGSYEKALPLYEQSLAMHEKLYPASKYPDGHPDLANSLNNLGSLLQDMRSFEKALAFFERALAMTRKLYPPSEYPDGHLDLAQCLNNLGIVSQAMGSSQKALTFFEEALAIQQKLYPASKFPDGHYYLAASLNNLASMLHAMGSYTRAVSLFEQALTMNRKLFAPSKCPDGHSTLAANLYNLGCALHDAGSNEKALDFLDQALAMQRNLGDRELQTASEAQALEYIGALPASSSSYLSVAVQYPETAAATYSVAWTEKSAVMKLLARRHLAASVQRGKSDDLSRGYERLGDIRREIARLLNQPGDDLAERDKKLAQLSDQRDRLERDLARQLPELSRELELAKWASADLLAVLPVDAVLIDFVRYSHWEEGKLAGARYLAFVLASGQPIRRIKLGPAAPIDAAIADWRRLIEKRAGSEMQETLAKLVWKPIAKYLPLGARTLYISPDGDLARLPWCALPGANPGTVLLEEFTGGIAIVPHGPFLLEQLKFPGKYEGPESVLIVGGVDYGTSRWPRLPGTEVELKAIAALAPREREVTDNLDASAQRLTEVLPKFRYAHLATHGFFNEEELAAEKKRQQEAIKSYRFVETGTQRRLAAKNPLGFTGLVLANGEVLTGLGLVDLPLESLNLVTLSACETGLGEYTGGKGVENLQQAFHLAGCRNVVASLWKVNDAATAALMAKFYHEVWINKKSPIEALREAQLTIYRRPDLIPALAAERGAPKLKEAVEVKVGEPGASAAGAKRADTKLWAAFVLSGVGK